MAEKYIPKEYSPTHCAYMAGIVDGEGGLTIGSYSKGPTGNPWYATYLTISSTDEVLINWLVAIFGSHKMIYTSAQMAANCRRQVYRWQCGGDRLYHICESILPYVVIKTRQVEIVMEFLKTSKTRVYSIGNRGPKIPDEVYQRRAELCVELKSYHIRKGPLKND